MLSELLLAYDHAHIRCAPTPVKIEDCHESTYEHVSYATFALPARPLSSRLKARSLLPRHLKESNWKPCWRKLRGRKSYQQIFRRRYPISNRCPYMRFDEEFVPLKCKRMLVPENVLALGRCRQRVKVFSILRITFCEWNVAN